MRHIVHVYQDQMRVEHYARTETGFDLTVLKKSNETIELEAVEFSIALEQVYFDVQI